jgi:hypothetical protein
MIGQTKYEALLDTKEREPFLKFRESDPVFSSGNPGYRSGFFEKKMYFAISLSRKAADKNLFS